MNISMNRSFRSIRCAACKQTFPTSDDHSGSVSCPHCGVTKALPRLEQTAGSDSETFDTASASVLHTASESQTEWSLKPPVDRARPKAETHYQLSDWTTRTPSETKQPEPAVASGMTSSYGNFPNRRDYPTLSALRRLYTVFGYAAVLIVFPYLLLEAIMVVYRADGDLLVQLAMFSKWAVPTVFATVAVTGAMLATSEGITLAMDVQENTLRTANELNRRRQ